MGGVTEEEVVGVWAVAADSENLNEVEELAVDVPHYGDRCADVDDVALAHEQLLGLGADGLDDGLGEELFLVEARDALVQVDGRCETRGGVSVGQSLTPAFSFLCRLTWEPGHGGRCCR